ncbi:MAG: DUF3887 domain-containing protein [Cyclobacteriaceae bacterium]|nr:DUF3887 domain-containing protein [Cyclobacteriaceae bacterium HetDA_MAG_MS6]
MKTSQTLFFAFVALLSLSACSQDYQKLSENQTDLRKIEIARDFSDRFYNTLKSGKTYEFSGEATEPMANLLSADKQKEIYQQISNQFGHYKSIQYAETWTSVKQSDTHIIRFKGEFEKTAKRLEIRVVINDEGKIAGFWIKPWLDPLT